MPTCPFHEVACQIRKHVSKYGFHLIALKVIFKGWKGLTLSLFCHFDTYCQFIQNLLGTLFYILAWSFTSMVLMNCEEMVLI